MLLIGGFFMLVWGIVMFFAPGTIYEITQSWKSYSMGDPSDRYIFTVRFRGVLVAIGGVLAMIVFFVT